jgi:hypothetical protein
MDDRFKIVFKKLDELAATERDRFGSDDDANRPTSVSAEIEEAREISELRRLAVELAEPEPKFFTGN